MQQLTAAIPQADLKDWMDRRGKNYRANIKMLEMTGQEIFRYFIIGRDDSWPYCQSHREVRDMAALTGSSAQTLATLTLPRPMKRVCFS